MGITQLNCGCTQIILDKTSTIPEETTTKKIHITRERQIETTISEKTDHTTGTTEIITDLNHIMTWNNREESHPSNHFLERNLKYMDRDDP